MKAVHRTLSISMLAALAAPHAHAVEVNALGFVDTRLAYVDQRSGWLEGGFGRLPLGGKVDDDASSVWTVRGDVGFELKSDDESFRLLVHLTARTEPGDAGGDPGGIAQAFVEQRFDVADNQRLVARVGQFFIPGSREAVLPLWQSPYTQHLSAINSWIAEEVRPIGVELAYRYSFGEASSIEAAGLAFVGNDTSGTLLAWRGFSFHDRLGVLGETVPLPPSFAFEPGFGFAIQNPAGTTPFTKDFDGDLGFGGRLRLQLGDKLNFSAKYVDNHGNRDLYEDEYAWGTNYGLVGAEWQPTESLTLAAEWLDGRTQMGFPGSPWVLADFNSAYLLAAWRTGAWQVAGRIEQFETVEGERSPRTEGNDEDGTAFTLNLAYEPNSNWRYSIEWLRYDSERELPTQQGAPLVDFDGSTLSAQVRYSF